jgi:hypothetical protein
MTLHSTAFTLLAIFIVLPVDAGKLRRRLQMYTLTDLADHNSETSCWLGIDDKVWDVTNYYPTHPLGPASVLNRCGQEITSEFYNV